LSNRNSPALVDGGTWSKVSAGSFNSVAIKSDGTLWGWGTRSGDGTINKVTSPKKIMDGSWTYCSGGSYSSAALRIDGTLWVWGDNFQGQMSLGQGGASVGQSYIFLSPYQADSGTLSCGGQDGTWSAVECGSGTGSQMFVIR